MGIEYIDVASRYHMGIASAHRLMGDEGEEEDGATVIKRKSPYPAVGAQDKGCKKRVIRWCSASF